MALGVEQQASAWSTIDAEDSIGLLRTIIAVRYLVARVINPISSDPSSRRWSNKKTSMKHKFGLQKAQEEQIKRQYMPYTKERSPHGIFRSAFRSHF